MILSDTRILEEIGKGTIKVDPYNRECLGSNSYDVHLGKWLAKYKDEILADLKKRLSLKDDDKISLVTLNSYENTHHGCKRSGRNGIAKIFCREKLRDAAGIAKRADRRTPHTMEHR